MSSVAPAIVIVLSKTGDGAYYEAKWRDRDGRQVKRRLGQAWVEPASDSADGWRKRRGRTPDGWLDPRTVHVAAAETVEQVQRERDEAAATAARAAAVTFRRVAQEWLTWRREVKGGAPSTLRDNEALLREPGEAHKRGAGVSPGRIMARFGDRPPAEITTKDVSRFLRELDRSGIAPKTVNKYRELLHAIFNYAMRSDTYGDVVRRNPVTETDKRRQPPPAPLDHYERDEIEALVRVCEQGRHRVARNYKGRPVAESADELAAQAAEDCQDAAAFALMFYSGLRLGELLALRWRAVRFLPDLGGAIVTVERAVSAGIESRRSPAARATSPSPVPRPRPSPASANAPSSSLPTTMSSAAASANASTAQPCAAATSAPPQQPDSAPSASTASATPPAPSSPATASPSSPSATSTATQASAPRTATSTPSSTRTRSRR